MLESDYIFRDRDRMAVLEYLRTFDVSEQSKEFLFRSDRLLVVGQVASGCSADELTFGQVKSEPD